MNLTQKVLAKLRIRVEDAGGEKRSYGLCPFHVDKNPTTFFVRLRGERAGLFHCFACKTSGNLLDLVMKRRDCSLRGAQEWLEELRAGADVEEERPKLDGVRLVVSPLGRRAFRMPAEVHAGPLESWVTPARRYAEERHLDEPQLARWGIGYAVSGRLAGRLVIPVRDRGGEARSYMARTFADHEARYYYPREREHADPDVIFGEEHWRGSYEVVVCEGALNALAVERALGQGAQFPNVAALGGSDVRPMHVLKLAGFARVVVLTDDDGAGDGAAVVLTAQLGRHARVVRVSLGRGRDADSVPPDELRGMLCRSGTTTPTPTTAPTSGSSAPTSVARSCARR